MTSEPIHWPPALSMGIRQRSTASGSKTAASGSNNPARSIPLADDGLNDGTDWLERRERLVRAALEDEDLEQLGRIAALPGGFGSEELRKAAWGVLLRTHEFFPAEGSTGSRGGRRDLEPEDSQERAGEKSDDGRHDDPTDHAVPASDNAEEPADTRSTSCNATESPELKPHPDEYQVLLDTKRSFVSYPKGLPAESKLAMQADLQGLIVHVLRLYPSLSYFQGFHDIISVLYLTFIPLPPAPTRRSRSASIRSRDRSTSGRSTPFSGTMTPVAVDAISLSEKSDVDQPAKEKPDTDIAAESAQPDAEDKQPTAQGRRDVAFDLGAPAVDRDTPVWIALKRCAEVVSVCRVRDAMGSGMEPMMGMLKILQRLLHAADPDLSRFSAAISPVPTLPFFALSWILCLFSHDIDSLEPVQRMFDFLLSRNPVSAIYLAVAIMVAKKDQMFELARAIGPEAEEDPSLLHPLFSRLPPLVADTPEDATSATDREPTGGQGGRYDDEQNPYDPIPISRIFHITDDLLARYPWDGPVIRGKDIMGPGSVVNTYENEPLVGEGKWNMIEAEGMTNKEVILPGATIPDEPEEEAPPKRAAKRRPLKRRQQRQVALALGVVVVGVGIAVYGWRAGGSKAGWAGWWAAIMRSWAGRRAWDRGLGVLGRVEDVLSRRVRGIMS